VEQTIAHIMPQFLRMGKRIMNKFLKCIYINIIKHGCIPKDMSIEPFEMYAKSLPLPLYIDLKLLKDEAPESIRISIYFYPVGHGERDSRGIQ